MSRVDPDVVIRNLTTEAALSMYFLYEYLANNVKSRPVPPDVVSRASKYVFRHLSDGAHRLDPSGFATLFAGAFVLATIDREFDSCMDATGSERANDFVYEVRDLVRSYPKTEIDLYAHMHSDAARRIADAAETH